MKTIIAGSRTINDYNIVLSAVKQSGFNITEVVCGGAKGIDLLGERYAKENHLPVKYFYPDWKRLGKSAGYVRNRDMGEYGEALIAIWDGQSHGTKYMIDIAKEKGIPVHILIWGIEDGKCSSKTD